MCGVVSSPLYLAHCWISGDRWEPYTELILTAGEGFRSFYFQLLAPRL